VPWRALPSRDLVKHLEKLKGLGLVFRYETDRQQVYSAHPFLRDFFRNLLQTQPESVHQARARSIRRQAIAAFRHAPEWGGVLAFNEFGFGTVALKPTPWGIVPKGEWTDHEDRLAAEWLQKQGRTLPPHIGLGAVPRAPRLPLGMGVQEGGLIHSFSDVPRVGSGSVPNHRRWNFAVVPLVLSFPFGLCTNNL
jgi:hypothetical protein